MNSHNERTATERAERTAVEEALVKNGEKVRPLAMRTRGIPSGPPDVGADEGPREAGPPARERRRARADHDDDNELLATMERTKARKQATAEHELDVQKRRLEFEQPVLDEAHERQVEDTRACLVHEARVAADASAASLERSSFIQAIHDSAKQRGFSATAGR